MELPLGTADKAQEQQEQEPHLPTGGPRFYYHLVMHCVAILGVMNIFDFCLLYVHPQGRGNKSSNDTKNKSVSDTSGIGITGHSWFPYSEARAQLSIHCTITGLVPLPVHRLLLFLPHTIIHLGQVIVHCRSLFTPRGDTPRRLAGH